MQAASALDLCPTFSTSARWQRWPSYGRRKDEWDHQAELVTVELKQIEQQLIAAEIRLAVAEQELRNHDRQIDNARDDRSRFCATSSPTRTCTSG